MSQATRKPATGVQTISLSDRTTTRLLERWMTAQGAKQVAEAAVAAANALQARFQEEIATICDLPEGASANIDFKARVLTITPALTTNGHVGAIPPLQPRGMD